MIIGLLVFFIGLSISLALRLWTAHKLLDIYSTRIKK